MGVLPSLCQKYLKYYIFSVIFYLPMMFFPHSTSLQIYKKYFYAIKSKKLDHNQISVKPIKRFFSPYFTKCKILLGEQS